MTTTKNRSRGMPRRTEPLETRSRAPLAIGAVVVAVVALAAVAAFALSGDGGSDSLAEPRREAVGITGEALPVLSNPASDSAAGQVIPTITGTDLEGEPMTIQAGDGPMAIVLLAHWCDHCRAEVPVITDYLEANGMPEGVEVVAISTSIDAARPNYPPSAWLEGEGWPVRTLVDDANSRALSSLGMNSFPGFIFVDGTGRVVQRMTGEIGAEAFDQAVTALAR